MILDQSPKPAENQATPPPSLKPYFDRRRIRMLRVSPDAKGLLAGMRIRKKLVVLHTLFSLTLAAILLIAVRPAVTLVVSRAEVEHARLALDASLASFTSPAMPPSPASAGDSIAIAVERLGRAVGTGTRLRLASGTPQELDLDPGAAQQALATPLRTFVTSQSVLGPGATVFVPPGVARSESFHVIAATLPYANAAASSIYWILALALLAVYALVAIALEVIVLPQNVYAPIQRMLVADAAVQSGRKEEELIPEAGIPGDELGEIMRSRNETVVKLREQEAALAQALRLLEHAAGDLKRKNHLLETAQRNLTESDRLASLGMMSAGIAHELNTPLAVIKGCVEQLNQQPGQAVDPARAALMLRVVKRLERLGESLLDFARVRPATLSDVMISEVVQEAVTLVHLDRESSRVSIVNDIPSDLVCRCDADRMLQVFVNLIRNAVQAVAEVTFQGQSAAASLQGNRGAVIVAAQRVIRDGRSLVSITITDSGPGIDPAILAHLFEPFTSTRLDARGTGLGLAVAEGIVKEHGGVLLARNREDQPGAIFEIMLA